MCVCVVFIRRFDQNFFTPIEYIPNETIKDLGFRAGKEIMMKPIGKYGFIPIELTNGVPVKRGASNPVRIGGNYVISPVFVQGEFRNVGHLSQDNFRKDVRKLCAELSCGGTILRQGANPFYDMTINAPNLDILNKFAIRLVGTTDNKKVESKDNNDNNNNINNKQATKPIGSMRDTYTFETNGESQYLTFGSQKTIIKLEITPVMMAPNDNRESNDDTETSSH